MKHLRKFNENIDNEIQEFCENYLAYLLDKDFNIEYVGKKVLNKDDFNDIHNEIFEIIKYFDEELYQYTKTLF